MPYILSPPLNCLGTTAKPNTIHANLLRIGLADAKTHKQINYANLYFSNIYDPTKKQHTKSQ